MSDRYIQNVHTNSIKTNFADKKVVIFRPQSIDHFSGRQIYTGYTRLSEADYKKLLKESAVFKHFIELKKLVVHDELPPDAQTPHEALVSARKDVGKLNAALQAAETEKEVLQARIDELDRQYKELLGSSGSDQLIMAEAALEDTKKSLGTLNEEHKTLQDAYEELVKKEKESLEKIQSLTVLNEDTKKSLEGMKERYKVLQDEHEKLVKKGK
jgi:chromosome segregation ATPase